MLNTLTVKNFGKLEDFTVTFTAGLNAIRAANEQGKSTLLKAICYAFWGARALPDSLDDTVTWGKPVSSLKVILTFSLSGVSYRITRSKSGAELTTEGVSVSGHEAVTSYVETLTKASQSVGYATLMSSQSSLSDSLDSSAIALIEKLSNMGLIDHLVTKVQDNLPTGSTKSVEAILGAGAPLLPLADFSEHITAIKLAEDRLELANQNIANLGLVLTNFGNIQEIKVRLNKEAYAKELHTSLTSSLARLEKIEAPAKPEYVNIDALEKLSDAQKAHGALSKSYQEFVAVVQGETRPAQEIKALGVKALEDLEKAKKSVSDLTADMRVITAQKITGTVCGLCGESFENIPKVVETNEKLDNKLKYTEGLLAVSKETLSNATAVIQSLEPLRTKDTAMEKLAWKLGKLVNVDISVVPRKLTWVGSPPGNPDTVDYQAQISAARQAEKDYATQVARMEQQESTRNRLVADLAAIQLVHALPSDRDTLEQYQKAAIRKPVLDGEKLSAEASLALCKSKFSSEVDVHNLRLAVHAEKLADYTRNRELLAEMVYNNQLVKKLREARPIVAKELWGLVLSGISTIFSQIRGMKTVVTRTSDRFMIDGKKAESFSGSAKDSLGMAIRFMLQKTFLPTVDFTILDEPASAADSQRESDMLATITGLGFAQVILVTHSDIADTFADNIITL